MDSILSVKNLTKTYENFKLDNVSFDLPKGCIMGFIGENGAGKSTTIKSILNLIEIDGGSISILGTDNLSANKKLKESIGVVFDENCFPENLTTKEINKIIKKYTKHNVPHFFVYAKDKTEYQVEPSNDSTMNRISVAIPDSRVKYSKSIGKFDWTVLIDRDVDYTIRETSPIIERYNYWLTHRRQFNAEMDNVKDDDLYMYRCIRDDIVGDYDPAYVVNSLVAYAYTVKKVSNKKMLWACFGWDIVENIRRNVVGLGNICPICGKRFVPRDTRQQYCSAECGKVADNQRRIAAYEAPFPTGKIAFE